MIIIMVMDYDYDNYYDDYDNDCERASACAYDYNA